MLKYINAILQKSLQMVSDDFDTFQNKEIVQDIRYVAFYDAKYKCDFMKEKGQIENEITTIKTTLDDINKKINSAATQLLAPDIFNVLENFKVKLPEIQKSIASLSSNVDSIVPAYRHELKIETIASLDTLMTNEINNKISELKTQIKIINTRTSGLSKSRYPNEIAAPVQFAKMTANFIDRLNENKTIKEGYRSSGIYKLIGLEMPKLDSQSSIEAYKQAIDSFKALMIDRLNVYSDQLGSEYEQLELKVKLKKEIKEKLNEVNALLKNALTLRKNNVGEYAQIKGVYDIARANATIEWIDKKIQANSDLFEEFNGKENPLALIKQSGEEYKNLLTDIANSVVVDNEKVIKANREITINKITKEFDELKNIHIPNIELVLRLIKESNIDRSKLNRMMPNNLPPDLDASHSLDMLRAKILRQSYLDKASNKDENTRSESTKDSDNYKGLINNDGLPSDELLKIISFKNYLLLITRRFENMRELNKAVENTYYTLPFHNNGALYDHYKKEVLEYYLDHFDPAVNNLNAQEARLLLSRPEYAEIRNNHEVLNKTLDKINLIFRKYIKEHNKIDPVIEKNIRVLRDLFKVYVPSHKLVNAVEKAMLNIYWHMKNKNNQSFFSDPLANKLEKVLHSPDWLNVVNKYGDAVIWRDAKKTPNLTRIQNSQREFKGAGFRNVLNNIRFPNDETFEQYFNHSTYKFGPEDRIDFNNPTEKDRVRVRIILKDIVNRQKIYDDVQMKNFVGVTDLEACKELIPPAQMEKDKNNFLFTTNYQELQNQLSPFYLKTERRAIVDDLLANIGVMKEAEGSELDKAIVMKTIIKGYYEDLTRSMWYNKLFGSMFKPRSNLGDALAKFMDKLDAEIAMVEKNKTLQLQPINQLQQAPQQPPIRLI